MEREVLNQCICNVSHEKKSPKCRMPFQWSAIGFLLSYLKFPTMRIIPESQGSLLETSCQKIGDRTDWLQRQQDLLPSSIE